MALQAFANRAGFLLTPSPNAPEFGAAGGSSTQLDAAGESVAFIGHLLLASGPGTSKVFSSGGAKVHWLTGLVTFANAGTTLRVGVQDVAATGLEDGTFDVSADLVGGTDAIAASDIISSAMEAGTKTIAHGDLVAVCVEVISRGGSDLVAVHRGSAQPSAMVPYCTIDTGAGPIKQPTLPLVTLEADDGTLAWFSVDSWVFERLTPTAFSSSSTPDEHALIFRLPVPALASGLFGRLAAVAAADDFEMILYSDPFGTPVAERTIAQDMDMAAVPTAGIWERPIAPFTLQANTDYAIALRPTTTNTLQYQRLEFGAGNGNLRGATPLGTNWSLGTRTDQTGAFTQDTTILPLFGVRLAQFDDGAAGGGGAEVSHVFVG